MHVNMPGDNIEIHIVIFIMLPISDNIWLPLRYSDKKINEFQVGSKDIPYKSIRITMTS